MWHHQNSTTSNWWRDHREHKQIQKLLVCLFSHEDLSLTLHCCRPNCISHGSPTLSGYTSCADPTAAFLLFSLWAFLAKKVISYELCVTPPVEWRIALCVCLLRKDSSCRGWVQRRGEREPELLSLKIWVFTGANGLCHHDATTVQCLNFIFYICTKPTARTQAGKEE